MTELVWDAVGERIFEAGVDHGVLHVDGIIVPWSGLVSVEESTTGGERTPYYLDGVMYLNLASDTEFGATIQAFTYPDEFAVCDGTIEIDNGLLITNQERKAFDFSYRTRIGNDIDGTDHGYKLHFVYNAYASPTQSSYQSLGETIEPSLFSWTVTTLPTELAGYKPTAHFIIDSRKTQPDHLEYLEEYFYGRNGSYPLAPNWPTLSELIQILSNPVPRPGFFDGGGPVDLDTWNMRDAGNPSSIATEVADGGILEAFGGELTDTQDSTTDGGSPSSTYDYYTLDGGTP